MKRYKFTYQYCDIEFNVDENIFTKEQALEFLEFFDWKYNKEENPIQEALQKVAIKCLLLSLNGFNDYGIKEEIANKEGYFAIDGSSGVELKWMDDYEIDEEAFFIEIIDLKSN